MTQLIDELSPAFVGAKLLVLTRANPDEVLRAFTAILVDVDYSATDANGGIMMPLEFIVDGPSPTSLKRDIFGLERGGISRRVPPSQISFIPQEGGHFHMMIREIGHNGAYGTLEVDVEGAINDPSVAQGQDA